jgi:hypothetical protein
MKFRLKYLNREPKEKVIKKSASSGNRFQGLPQSHFPNAPLSNYGPIKAVIFYNTLESLDKLTQSHLPLYTSECLNYVHRYSMSSIYYIHKYSMYIALYLLMYSITFTML